MPSLEREVLDPFVVGERREKGVSNMGKLSVFLF